MNFRVLLLMLLSSSFLLAQNFQLDDHEEDGSVDFELINNLIIAPVEVNGVLLNFIVDSGVGPTIIFATEDIDSIQLRNATQVDIRGLGTGERVETWKTERNTLRIGNAINKKQTLYLVVDPSLNFSPRLGIPIHGIIGTEFFQQFVVEVNYRRKRIVFTLPEFYEYDRCRRCQTFPIQIYRGRPFINAVVNNQEIKLLLDTGSGDGLWIYKLGDNEINIPEIHFKDYLGYGLSGPVNGVRSKIESLKIGDFTLEEPTIAFPDSLSMVGAGNNIQYDGLIGGEILKRFTILFDYENEQVTMRANRNFNDPFYYNLAGITLVNDGFSTELQALDEKLIIDFNPAVAEVHGITTIRTEELFVYALVNDVVIDEITEGSPAALSGLEVGDQVLEINGNRVTRKPLHYWMSMFYSDPGRRISFKVKRNGETLKFVLWLKKRI